MNLTTVAVPNLIAHDLVIVHPMSSMSGYITYIEYTRSTSKGATTAGDKFADPFGMYHKEGFEDYTAARVVEPVTAAGTFAPAWDDAVVGAFLVKDNKEVPMGTEGAERMTYKVVHADKSVEYFAEAPTVAEGDKVAYMYNNIVIPQKDGKLPTIKAEMKSIPLVAKARRIAVYYSQIAAYQAKTDYGVDLGDQLAEKAVGELAYEIDTEITNMLSENAGVAKDDLVWSKTLPVGVSKTEHYEGFVEVLEIAKKRIYDATKKFAPNFVLAASDILPVLSLVKGWQAAPAGQVNGPYFAGTINGLKVFVTPNIEEGRFVIGCNGSDMMSSAAVYAPYMAIVPTQLLGFADGGMSQGWSTLYDLKMLNKNLLVAGKIEK